MARPEPAFARRWRTRLNAALTRRNAALPTSPTDQTFYFPLAQYLSLHLVLSIFLVFSIAFLPRSQAWLDGVLGSGSAVSGGERAFGVKQTVSSDRPEHPFLTPLTADAVVTMGWTVAGLVVSMGWWAAHLRGWWTASRAADAAAAGNQLGKQDPLTAAKKASLAVLASSLIIYPLLTLLGAPTTSQVPPTLRRPAQLTLLFYRHNLATLLLSVHLSLLLVFPPAYALGIPSLYESGSYERYRLTRLFCELEPTNQLERATVYPVVGAVVGAWVGVIPLALDWDRPWQTYPLPPACASIVGFILGGLASFMYSIVGEAVDAGKAAIRAEAEEVRAERERQGEKGRRRRGKGGKVA